VLVSDFHFDLPEELIAQEALADRAASRLLRLDSASGEFADCRFRDFPEMLRGDDLLVFNNTRVFPARLFGRRAGRDSSTSWGQRFPDAPEVGTPHSHVSQNQRDMGHPIRKVLQGRVEVLLTRQVSALPNEWECLVRPGRKIGVGERLFFGEQGELQGEVVARGEFGERRIRFELPGSAEVVPPGSAGLDSRGRLSPHQPSHSADFFEFVEKIGHVPLPPYIARADSAGDRERYQTVYARERGSVAAPTAGLHFTPEILRRIGERGIESAEITLHVGLGTFQPVRVERVEEHRLHAERYSISEDAAGRINRARRDRRRIVAVGTTTVRTLEYAAQSGEVLAGSWEAEIFIYPGYRFRVVRALLTNFHLPQSTLLMLVCALGGKENVLRAYGHAVREKYRFYSYGDCMFVE
jgi:S-adenosylmethionine:tRNA ribosyltransferase-isomerase